jgi:RNA polymerase sigma-70 factor (ECF subfamily)
VTVTDRDVIRDVLAGDRNAFAQLVEVYQRRLFGLALMMVREPDVAEEVAHDTFVRAFIHLRQYDASRAFYPWLAAIAVRLAQNWMRQRGRTVRRQGVSLEDVEEPTAAASALSTLIADEQSRRVWRAVASLPSGERTAALLYYRDGLLVRDIAMVLAVSPGTIKTLLFRARRHLRERVGTESTSDEGH